MTDVPPTLPPVALPLVGRASELTDLSDRHITPPAAC